MAKLNIRQLIELNRIAKRFEKGELLERIPTDKMGAYGDILRILERNRVMMLALKAEKDQTICQTQNAIANVVHDLKTPIAVISGYVECLQDGLNDKNYAELIGKKAEELNKSVVNIIDVAKNEIESAQNDAQIVDAREFFKLKHEPIAEDKNLVKVKAPPKCQLVIDKKKIKQVLENLVRNAIMHSGTKKPVGISFYKGLHYFIIKVKDSGKGIDKETLPHIFEKFYMGDKSRSKGGSGVGLAYAKEVVESNGGKIWCKSKPGKGSSFYVALPIYKPNKKQADPLQKELILEILRVFVAPFMYVYDFFYMIYLFIKMSQR